MSDLDISAETVERLAIDYDDHPPCASNCGCSPACGVRSVASCICTRTAATLRALRAALDAAEQRIHDLNVVVDNWRGLHEDTKAQRDAAQAALLAAEHALNMERARVHECRTIQREMARDIQALQPPADLAARAQADRDAVARAFAAGVEQGRDEALADERGTVPKRTREEALAALRARAGA